MFQVLAFVTLFVTVLCERDYVSNFDHLYSNFKGDAAAIITHLTRGLGKGDAFKTLATLTDTYGNRLVGSAGFDAANRYLVDQLHRVDAFDKVGTEEVVIPNWVRGKESAELMLPRRHKMRLLGLGTTVSTPVGGITADVVVVRSFDELDRLGAQGQVKGKMVVYNQGWVNYEQSVDYRENGADRASGHGAVASLVRSAASHSNYSPATGANTYAKNAKIPTACITIEDAEMLWRMQTRGDTPIRIRLNIQSHPIAEPLKSVNTVAELTGTDYPEEVVLISGHFDSWDVGTGAMDDGGGVMLAWEALRTLKALGLRPKRTIRAVFWTAEEEGHYGSQAYYQRHKNNTDEKFIFVSESDAGAFPPSGLNFTGNKEQFKYMYALGRLLAPLNASRLFPLTDGGDVQWWIKDGVPGVWLENPDWDDYYFRFHHTDGDTMTVFNSDDLDRTAAVWTIMAHVIANFDVSINELS